MFVNKLFTYLRAHISKSKRCFNVKFSTYYFHMKRKILTDFQICISVPLSVIAFKDIGQFSIPRVEKNMLYCLTVNKSN